MYECEDVLDEIHFLSLKSLIRHLNNYNSLKSELLIKSHSHEPNKYKDFFIESLYVRRYVIALCFDWDNIEPIYSENHTYKQLAGNLSVPTCEDEMITKILSTMDKVEDLRSIVTPSSNTG